MSISLPSNWTPRSYQRGLWQYLQGGGKRAVVVAHRRFGKDDITLHHTACAAHRRVGAYLHMLPEYSQARKALWDMTNPHTGKRRIDEAFPVELRDVTRENEMFIRFKNGSTWQLAGSDNYNSLMGTSYAGIAFSEYALGNPSAYSYFSPILAENGGWAVIISTPRGHNHMESMLRVAGGRPGVSGRGVSEKGWYWEVAPASVTGALSGEILEDELRQMVELHGESFGRSLWMQEYEVSFDAAIPGAIFADTLDELRAAGGIGVVPWEPMGPVHTGWDLGRTDDTVIWFAQVWGGSVRVLRCHASNGKDVEFYARLLREYKEKYGWRYGVHWLPHDARPRTLAAGAGSILQQFEGWNKEWGGVLGKFEIAKRLDKQEQIQAGRATLKRAWIDEEGCKDGLEALRAYHREWDEEKRVFKDSPAHDWASHYADGWMTLGVAWRWDRHKQVSGDNGIDMNAVLRGSLPSQSFGYLKARHLRKAKLARAGETEG